MQLVPFSIRDPEQPDRVALVLAVTDGCLVIGPAPGDAGLRVVRLEDGQVARTPVEFSRLYFETPWHAPFTAPAPAEHQH